MNFGFTGLSALDMVRRGSSLNADLSGLYAQYDFQAANVVKNGSDQIATLTDIGGGAAPDVTASVDANKIVWSGAQWNGRDIGVCDNTATSKRATATVAGNLTELAFTVAVVAQLDVNASINQRVYLIGDRNNATGNGGFRLCYHSTSRDRELQFISSTGVGSTARFGTATLGQKEILVVSATASADDAAATVIAEVNGTSVAIVGSPNYSTVDGAHLLEVGSLTTAGGPIHRMGAIYYWRRALDADSRLQLARDLGVLYGIATA